MQKKGTVGRTCFRRFQALCNTLHQRSLMHGISDKTSSLALPLKWHVALADRQSKPQCADDLKSDILKIGSLCQYRTGKHSVSQIHTMCVDLYNCGVGTLNILAVPSSDPVMVNWPSGLRARH